MKKLLILIINILSVNYTFSQIRLSANDLLNLIKSRGGVFNVVEKSYDYDNEKKKKLLDDSLRSVKYFNDIDNVLKNEELKNELLKLLTDTIEYSKYRTNEYIARIQTDTMLSNGRLTSWLNRKNYGFLIDTILKTPQLYNQYLDSTLLYEKEYNFDFYYQRFRISTNSKQLLTRIKYPESYSLFYKNWEKDGKTQKSQWFDILLEYQDPEAIKIYDDYIQKVIDTKDAKELSDIRMFVIQFNNSYKVQLLLKLLKEATLSYEDQRSPMPFNIYLITDLSILEHILLYMEPKILDYVVDTIISDYIYVGEDNMPNVNKAQEMFQSCLDKIIPWFQPYLNILLKEELKWKQNMPYYKKEEE